MVRTATERLLLDFPLSHFDFSGLGISRSGNQASFKGRDKNEWSVEELLPFFIILHIHIHIQLAAKLKKGKVLSFFSRPQELTLTPQSHSHGGNNLKAVMGVAGVAVCKTTSNHISEVQATLGTETARKCITGEIKDTLIKFGISIDMQHMTFLADRMSYKDEVFGITSFVITKMKESVLTLESFGKTTDHLINGSFIARRDNIEGVAECIIMVIPMPLETGILEVRQR